ncbi:hypothetical protein [Larkinella harenae]
MKGTIFSWFTAFIVLSTLLSACQGKHKQDRNETTTAPRRPTDLLEAPHVPPTVKPTKKSQDSATTARPVRIR